MYVQLLPFIGNADQSTVATSERLTLGVSCCSESKVFNCKSSLFTHTCTYIDVMSIEPEMWVIIKIVFPKIKAKWKYLAYFMKYKPHEVNAFESDANDLEGRCLNLFADWLTTNHGIAPKTWYNLIEQIKIVDGLQNAAENIEKEVKELLNI